MINGETNEFKTYKLTDYNPTHKLNSLKELAGIDNETDLIPAVLIEPIQRLKLEHMGSRNPRLHTDEILMALSICAVSSPTAKLALDQLGKLKGAELHSSAILPHVDEKTFKKLGLRLTSEPIRQAARLYNT